MSIVEPLVGIGRIFAQGRLLALVEYVLVLTVVGHFHDMTGSITILEGSHELDAVSGLKLQLNNGKTTPITALVHGSPETYDISGVYHA